MSELPKFRRIEDVQRFLDEMRKDIDLSGQLVTQQQKLLAKLAMPTPKLRAMLSAAVEFDVTPDVATTNSNFLKHLKKKIDPALKKVVIPNLAKLKDQYGLMEDLYQKHTTLDSAATQIAMQFPDRRGPLYDKALGSINELKSKVEEQLRTVFTFLSKVAQKHVPAEFQAYTAAVAAQVSDHVFFEDSERFLYVSIQDGELKADFAVSGPESSIKPEQHIVFTEYMLLTDSVSDDGGIAPQLYIVAQWVVGGQMSIYVEHEFTPPNQLSGGSEVTTVQEATAAIAHLLEIEGFASYLGTVPLSLQLRVTPDQLKPSMFEGRNYIDKIMVDETKITFIFKHHLTSKETKKKIALAIFPQVKAMLRTKNAKLRVSLTDIGIVFYIANPANEGEMNTYDLEFMKTKYGLSDAALRRMAQIVHKRDIGAELRRKAELDEQKALKKGK